MLKGGAKDIQVQVGLNVADKLGIKVNDISTGKLFRSSITTALNTAIRTGGNITTYYVAANNATELDLDVRDNVNLFHAALTAAAPNAVTGPRGSGAALTAIQFGVLFFALSPEQKVLLDQIAPVAKAFLTATNPGVTFVNATAVQFQAIGLGGDAGSLAEITALVADNVATNISVVGNVANRVLAQDVFKNALDAVRTEQAGISTQKANVVEAADALRATTNVTQKAADSYLKTDYVLTSQEYSETIRTMVAAITALQAANKIPEAAQRLIDALAR